MKNIPYKKCESDNCCNFIPFSSFHCEVCVKEITEGWAKEREVDRQYKAFFHGSADAIHVHGVGYVDPHSREGKRYLDP